MRYLSESKERRGLDILKNRELRKLIKVIAVSLTLSIVSACVTPSEVDIESTTIYLVRHAEKVKDSGRDPALTTIGEQRARKWADILSKEPIKAVYSTDTIRTRDTAKPIAAKHGLEVELYSAKEVNHLSFLSENRGKSAVVVGHSNTVPGFVNGLLNQDAYADLDESQYSNLYIVTDINGVATAQVLLVHLDNLKEEK
jgi:phosphohistidine phosphatase SixA